MGACTPVPGGSRVPGYLGCLVAVAGPTKKSPVVRWEEGREDL